MSDPNSILVMQLGEVQGTLKMMTQMIQQNQISTNQRIDDFRGATEGRLEGVDARISTIDEQIKTIVKNERGTALRAASSGAMSGALVAATVEAIKLLANIR